jgi:hypothetical protein
LLVIESPHRFKHNDALMFHLATLSIKLPC